MFRVAMFRRMIAILTMGLVALLLPTAAPAAQAAYCGISWGSLPKAVAPTGVGFRPVLTNVRTGRHTCFDRLVIDLAGDPSRVEVEYVSQVFHREGEVLEMRGGANLGVLVHAAAHDDDYNPTFLPANRYETNNVAGYRTFRQVFFGGTYEGLTDMAIGVRARLPFRVFVLDDGAKSRIVIDVAHLW